MGINEAVRENGLCQCFMQVN